MVFSQAAHQVDIVRLLGGGARDERASRRPATGIRRARPKAPMPRCSRFDGRRLRLAHLQRLRATSIPTSSCGWIGELGRAEGPAQLRREPARAAKRRRMPHEEARDEERAQLWRRELRRATPRPPPSASPAFRPLVVAARRADLRPTPAGVMIYGDTNRSDTRCRSPTDPARGSDRRILRRGVRGPRPAHDGAWGLATMEVVLAILRSAREGGEVRLTQQVAR